MYNNHVIDAVAVSTRRQTHTQASQMRHYPQEARMLSLNLIQLCELSM